MNGIRCSLISLSAEVHVFRKLCSTTSGKHAVALDESHMELLISDHIQPPVATREQEASVVKMGFPKRSVVRVPSFCVCHQSQSKSAEKTNQDQRAFFCPQCGARYCQTPTECRICGLLLLTAPQLARAHQHLQPLPAFAEVPSQPGRTCFACDQPLSRDHKAYACKSCQEEFCIDCDILLHESLQTCPSCG